MSFSSSYLQTPSGTFNFVGLRPVVRPVSRPFFPIVDTGYIRLFKDPLAAECIPTRANFQPPKTAAPKPWEYALFGSVAARFRGRDLYKRASEPMTIPLDRGYLSSQVELLKRGVGKRKRPRQGIFRPSYVEHALDQLWDLEGMMYLTPTCGVNEYIIAQTMIAAQYGRQSVEGLQTPVEDLYHTWYGDTDPSKMDVLPRKRDAGGDCRLRFEEYMYQKEQVEKESEEEKALNGLYRETVIVEERGVVGSAAIEPMTHSQKMKRRIILGVGVRRKRRLDNRTSLSTIDERSEPSLDSSVFRPETPTASALFWASSPFKTLSAAKSKRQSASSSRLSMTPGGDFTFTATPEKVAFSSPTKNEAGTPKMSPLRAAALWRTPNIFLSSPVWPRRPSAGSSNDSAPSTPLVFNQPNRHPEPEPSPAHAHTPISAKSASSISASLPTTTPRSRRRSSLGNELRLDRRSRQAERLLRVSESFSSPAPSPRVSFASARPFDHNDPSIHLDLGTNLDIFGVHRGGSSTAPITEQSHEKDLDQDIHTPSPRRDSTELPQTTGFTPINSRDEVLPDVFTAEPESDNDDDHMNEDDDDATAVINHEHINDTMALNFGVPHDEPDHAEPSQSEPHQAVDTQANDTQANDPAQADDDAMMAEDMSAQQEVLDPVSPRRAMPQEHVDLADPNEEDVEKLRQFVKRHKEGQTLRAASAEASGSSSSNRSDARRKRRSGSSGPTTSITGSPLSRSETTEAESVLAKRTPLGEKDPNMSPSPMKKRKAATFDEDEDDHSESDGRRSRLQKPALDDHSPPQPKRRRKKAEPETDGILNPEFQQQQQASGSSQATAPTLRRSRRNLKPLGPTASSIPDVSIGSSKSGGMARPPPSLTTITNKNTSFNKRGALPARKILSLQAKRKLMIEEGSDDEDENTPPAKKAKHGKQPAGPVKNVHWALKLTDTRTIPRNDDEEESASSDTPDDASTASSSSSSSSTAGSNLTAADATAVNTTTSAPERASSPLPPATADPEQDELSLPAASPVPAPISPAPAASASASATAPKKGKKTTTRASRLPAAAPSVASSSSSSSAAGPSTPGVKVSRIKKPSASVAAPASSTASSAPIRRTSAQVAEASARKAAAALEAANVAVAAAPAPPPARPRGRPPTSAVATAATAPKKTAAASSKLTGAAKKTAGGSKIAARVGTPAPKRRAAKT